MKLDEQLYEPYLYSHFYMKNKHWYKNKCGTPEGIVEILKKADMIESKKLVSLE